MRTPSSKHRLDLAPPLADPFDGQIRMSKAERSSEVFSASLKLAIRSYSIRLQVVAINLQNLRRASLRPYYPSQPPGQLRSRKAA
jgi:hypothetical protein